MKALLTCGRLKSVTILDPASGRTTKKSFTNRWLCWDGRTYVICTVKSRSGGSLPSAVAAKHRRFHGEPPKGAMIGDAPTPQGRLREIGLLKGLVYDVPGSVIRSPGKNPHLWHHAMGDTGHQGGDHYPTSVMPSVCVDARGNYFVRRRKGNIYRVDEWLRG